MAETVNPEFDSLSLQYKLNVTPETIMNFPAFFV